MYVEGLFVQLNYMLRFLDYLINIMLIAMVDYLQRNLCNFSIHLCFSWYDFFSSTPREVDFRDPYDEDLLLKLSRTLIGLLEVDLQYVSLLGVNQREILIDSEASSVGISL